MDLFDDFSESPAAKAPATSRFQPKAKPRPKKGPSTAAKSTGVTAAKSTGVTTATETPSARVVSDTKNYQKNHFVPDVSFSSSSPLRPCTSQIIRELSPSSTCHNTQDLDIGLDELEGRNSFLDSVEITNVGASASVVSEKRAVKLKPKLKGQDRTIDSVETIVDHQQVPLFSSENENVIGQGSNHTDELEPVTDPLHERLDRFYVTPVTDQAEDLDAGDTDLYLVSNILKQSEEHGELGGFDVPQSSDNEPDEASVLQPGNESNRDVSGFSDGINHEGFHENSNSPTEGIDDSLLHTDEVANSDQIEEENLPKKRGRKPKQAVSENDKPARKRKKAPKESDQSNKKPFKKFPHATTRRRRCVDKSLLEAPEDTIDLQRLPIKDLILLGEHKERLARKQVASVQPASTNERTDNLLSEDLPYDDAEPWFDQDRESTDTPSTSGIKTDTGYFNYHTYMKKESRAKWSKQDTELFYQGIRQFGSDLSMIQQLFPGRSRAQIKVKFKKEERQNPMMIQDAMANKAKDYQHFELVIERLQEAERKRAKEEEEYDADHPICEDENLEENPKTEETAKFEQNVKDDAADEELHRPPDESLGFHDKEEEEEECFGYYPGLL